MQNQVDQPRTIQFRSTIDKLSVALYVNAAANMMVAIAFVWSAMT